MTNETPTGGGKPKPVSPRIAEVVRLLVTGACTTQKAAAERTGLHPNHVSRALKEPHVRAFMEAQAREAVTTGTMRASARLVELLDSSSEHVSFEATKHVLGIAGIRPAAQAQVSVNIDVRAG